MRKLIYLVLLALPLMVLAVACQPENSPTTKREPAPAVASVPVSLKEIDAETLDALVKNNKGQLVLMDFWATWCGPCRASFPHFVELHKKYAEKGLLCISVSMNKLWPNGTLYDKNDVFAFLMEKNATFPNFIADGENDGKFRERFALDSYVPHKVLFSRAGTRMIVNEWTSEELTRKIESELGLEK